MSTSNGWNLRPCDHRYSPGFYVEKGGDILYFAVDEAAAKQYIAENKIESPYDVKESYDLLVANGYLGWTT